MNLIELQQALGQLRLGGIAAVLETRLRQAQSEASGAPTACLTGAESKPAFVTPTGRSTTSTSPSIRWRKS